MAHNHEVARFESGPRHLTQEATMTLVLIVLLCLAAVVIATLVGLAIGSSW